LEGRKNPFDPKGLAIMRRFSPDHFRARINGWERMKGDPSGLATFHQLVLGPVMIKGETIAAAIVIPYLTDDPFLRLSGFRFHFEMHAV
jgi:hypothetical protein